MGPHINLRQRLTNIKQPLFINFILMLQLNLIYGGYVGHLLLLRWVAIRILFKLTQANSQSIPFLKCTFCKQLAKKISWLSKSLL